MDLIFFDLDGTLLNAQSQISPYTKETLMLLKDKDIAYTVATGRTMLSAQSIIVGHDFTLPHIYNNGVTVWDPLAEELTLDNLLTDTETSIIIDLSLENGITPFVNSVDNHKHFIFHSTTQHQVEKDLIKKYFSRTKATLLPLESLPPHSHVTNISMIGDADVIHKMWLILNTHPNIIAYSGVALEGDQYRWMDIHHCLANKGSAVTNLKQKLDAKNVICFGDGDNDLSMFALADEAYAPANASDEVKRAASATIGHNDKDGIAHFLRERFSL